MHTYYVFKGKHIDNYKTVVVMKDFPIIYLLLYTKIGRVILGIIVVLLIVGVFGIWLCPIIAALIAIPLFQDYFDKEKEYRNKKELIAAICLVVFALGFIIYINRDRLFDQMPNHPDSYYHMKKYEVDDKYDHIDTAYVPKASDKPDTAYVPKSEKPSKKQNYGTTKSRSHNSSVDDYDNMRGFDPASEDDMDDNGMSRYMENDDEEGWN